MKVTAWFWCISEFKTMKVCENKASSNQGENLYQEENWQSFSWIDFIKSFACFKLNPTTCKLNHGWAFAVANHKFKRSWNVLFGVQDNAMQVGLEKLLNLLWSTLVGIASSCKNRVSFVSSSIFNKALNLFNIQILSRFQAEGILSFLYYWIFSSSRHR